MAFTGYVSDSKIMAKLDEKFLSSLASRTGSTGIEAYEKKVIDQAKADAAALFESYAVNKYELVDLRVDPPPAFAVRCNLILILYDLYFNNKRHVVPTELKEQYKEVMEMMAKWGDPQIIDVDEVVDSSSSSGLIAFNKTEDDLQFTEEKQKGFWG